MILFFLSEGVNSTSALVKLLTETEHEISVHHVIINKDTKQYEKVLKIVEYCRKQYRDFDFETTRIIFPYDISDMKASLISSIGYAILNGNRYLFTVAYGYRDVFLNSKEYKVISSMYTDGIINRKIIQLLPLKHLDNNDIIKYLNTDLKSIIS